VVATTLARLSDPRLAGVTVTGVDVSPDLAVARVYYSVLGTPDDVVRAAAGLRAAHPRLRGAIGEHVRMRRVPRLEFLPDPAVEAGRRVEAALRRLRPGPTGQAGDDREEDGRDGPR
jgi:ribosome-binding factor A